jgi:RNA polymerase sigma-54 factor
MAFNQKFEHRQKQIFSQGLRQTIKVLELPILDLREVVEAEMIENPAIEEIQEPLAPALPPEKKEQKAEETQANTYDDMEPNPGGYEESAPFEKPLPGKKESLNDVLLRQLRISTDDPGILSAGSQLINHIDENGYLRPEVFDDEEIEALAPLTLQKALALIQSFDPAGVGARNLKECLLLQLSREDDFPLARNLVADHLEELAAPDKEKLCKKCKCSTEELEAALKKIHSLEPKPGRSFNEENTAYITPDITIEEKDDALLVNVEHTSLPVMRVNPTYKNMLRSKTVDEATKEYIREKIKNATNLIHAIRSRRETLAKVVELIVAYQQEAIRDGMEKLRPLSCKEIAEKAGLHESTISRILMNKYVQTPLGVFALREFLSTSLRTDEGQDVSSQSIKMKINELIEQEDKTKPLTDQAIAAMIAEQEKTTIARRTVAKYRESLSIPPTSQRRTK